MDNNYLSKEELGNILLHNYHDVISKLKVFNELSEFEQKIVLLSLCFDSNIVIPYNYLTNIISDNGKSIINNIRNDYDETNPYIRFYYTDKIPKMSVTIYKNRILLTVPTKCDYLFSPLSLISKNELINAICNKWYYGNNNSSKYDELFNYVNSINEEELLLARKRRDTNV